GHYAIELAHAAGARVAATVSSAEKADLAARAGADLVVNYREPGAVDALRGFSPHVDRIVEVALGANLELDLAVSGAGTIIAIYASEPAGDPVIPTGRLMAANATLQYVLVYGIPRAALEASVAWVASALGDGRLSPLPFQRFPLEQVARAHDAVENNAVGKVLVLP
ncbi:MAG: zinc-binding dehydrogenase, partial [Clostridia bacterium]